MANKNFDWHSEEDVGWEEQNVTMETTTARPRRIWITLLLILGLIGAGSWAVVWQINQRIAAITAQVEADVQASHALMLDAAAHQDRELLRSVLSGRSPDWYKMQEELADAGTLLSRPLFGLTLSDTQTDVPPEIVLDPEFKQAEVSFTQAYLVQDADGVAQTVTLQQTAVYRHGAQRWLLAVPETEFWGGWRDSFGKHLILHYPARDEAWANRLAADLDALVAHTCSMFADLECADDLQMVLRLDSGVESLSAFLDPMYAWQTDHLYLRLPALTVLGMPLDEASYQAVYRAYGAAVVTAVITDLVNYQCCDNAPFFQVLLDYELSQLDLKPWPITQNDNQRVFTAQPSLDLFLRHWPDNDLTYLTSEDGWLVYAAFDFLLNTTLTTPLSADMPTITPIQLQRAMQPDQGFFPWLTTAFSGWEQTLGQGSTLMHSLEEGWWQYAYTQTLSVQGPPPIPYPDQALQLLCVDENTGITTTEELAILKQYDLVDQSWMEITRFNGFGFAVTLPDDETTIRNLWQEETGVWGLDIWHDQQSTSVPTEAPMIFSFGQVDPTEQTLVVITFAPEDGVPIFNLMSLDNCLAAACDLTPLLGFPFWSPDGRQTIVAEPPDNAESFFMGMMPINGRYTMFDVPTDNIAAGVQHLYLADASGQSLTSIGDGYAPFWLDNDTYGFIRLQENGETIIMVGTGDNLHSLLTLDDLLPYLPERASRLYGYRLGYAFAHPDNQDLLFVVVFDTATQLVYVLSFDQHTGAITNLLHTSYISNHTIGISPDGQRLLLTGIDQEGLANHYIPTLYLYEIASGKTDVFYIGNTNYSFVGSNPFDWDADGKWVASLTGREGVTIGVPGQDYWQFIPYNAASCISVSWVNR